MKTSEKLAELILAELHKQGWKHVTHCELRAAKGHWRTSRYADVYRFEGIAHFTEPVIKREIASWNTMTDCVKYGISISLEHGTWVVSPKFSSCR